MKNYFTRSVFDTFLCCDQ